MAFSQVTSVADWRALLTELKTFAVTTNSWTLEHDNLSGTNRQVAFSKGDCYIALGEPATNPTTGLGVDNESDARIFGALATSITVADQFWGQPGSPVTSQGDVDALRLNDVEGSLANVWFFSGGGGDPDYVHMVIQSASDRYSHFSFGHLDKVGQTHPNVAYGSSLYYEWWPDGPVDSNDPSRDTTHLYGHLGDSRNIHVNILASTLPVGFPAAGIYTGLNNIGKVMDVELDPSDHTAASSTNNYMDLFLAVANQLTTGGSPLWPLPYMFKNGALQHCHLGNLPGVRLVNMANHTPASTLDQGSDEWLVFPFKRKSSREAASGGSNEQDLANTINYGLAYKKNT